MGHRGGILARTPVYGPPVSTRPVSNLPHVCLIDDDPNAAFFVKRALRKVAPGARFTFFEDPRAALAHLTDQYANDRRNLPDVLLLDLNMPYLTGWDFIRHACGPEGIKPRDLKLCILSSSVNPDDVARAEQYDCVDHYLEKHVTAEALERVLAE